MASVPSDQTIQRRLRRKGYTPHQIASYLRGWHQLDPKPILKPVEKKPCKKPQSKKSKQKKTKSA